MLFCDFPQQTYNVQQFRDIPSSMQVQLSNVVIASTDAITQLENLRDSNLEGIDFATFTTELNRQIINEDLLRLATQLDSMADTARVSSSDLLSQVLSWIAWQILLEWVHLTCYVWLLSWIAWQILLGWVHLTCYVWLLGWIAWQILLGWVQLGPVSLRLMTSQFKDILTHMQKLKTVKCIFCGVWVQNFVWNFKRALWNFRKNFGPIHRKICILWGVKKFDELWYLRVMTS